MVPHVDPLDIAPILFNSYLFLSRNIDSLSKALANSPRGHLVKKQRGLHTYFYRQFWENGKQVQRYVKLQDLDSTRQALQNTRDLKAQLQLFRSILSRTAKALRHFGLHVQQLLSQHSADELLRQQEETARQHAWNHAQSKPYGPNYHHLVAIQGVPTYVASKSEALILLLLTAHGITVEYEPSLVVDGVPIKGDFKVYHKYRPGVVFYWDHLGLLHKPEYRKRWAAKLETYRKAGIVEGKNLIVTRDGPDGSIDMIQIEHLIVQYLET